MPSLTLADWKTATKLLTDQLELAMDAANVGADVRAITWELLAADAVARGRLAVPSRKPERRSDDT